MCVCVCVCVCQREREREFVCVKEGVCVRERDATMYGVATMSRMLKNIGLFCKRALQKRPVFCKETCIFKRLKHVNHCVSLFW